jgi:hypothetical protein
LPGHYPAALENFYTMILSLPPVTAAGPGQLAANRNLSYETVFAHVSDHHPARPVEPVNPTEFGTPGRFTRPTPAAPE